MDKGYREIRRTPWTKVINVILVILIGVLSTSIGAEEALIKGVSSAGFAKGISHRMMDTVFDTVGDSMEVLGQTQHEIENSKEVKDMSEKLVRATMKTIEGDEEAFEKVDLTEDVTSLVNSTIDKMKGLVTDSQLETMRSQLTSRIPEISQLLKESASYYTNPYSYSPVMGRLIKLFVNYTTNWFRVLTAILILVFVIIQYKLYGDLATTVKSTGIASLVSGVLVLILGFACGKLLLYTSERYLGRGIFMTNSFLLEGIVVIAVGLVLICCEKIFTRRNA